jgi:acetyltransferase-like isoleucine patch superfamily enzyme
MLQFIWKIVFRILNPSCTIRAASISRNVKLEKNVTLAYGCHIQADFIGKHTYINKYSLVDKNTKSIGRFCSIAYNVKIGLASHPTNWVSTHTFGYEKKYGFINKNRPFEELITERCIIGNDVWIGANSIILAGVKVGDGAIIGANSLVTKDVEPYAIVFGNPASFHRFRFDETIRSKLSAIKWWELNDDKIKRYMDVMDNPKNLIERAETSNGN